jgi:predicted nuclease of predicted toxin-antitoxin system
MRLLLDENVSPSLVRALREDGNDVIHVRDRGWSGDPDYLIWRRAVADSRTVVTINARDFRKLAEIEEIHAGLITFPSGEQPQGQLACIRRGIVAFEAVSGINVWVRVEIDREVVILLPEPR